MPPFNVISWSALAMAVIIIGVRGLASYRRTGNALTKYNSWYGITLGLDLICFYGPVWFTRDPAALRAWALAGCVFFSLSMLVQGLLVWRLYLKGRLHISIAVSALASLLVFVFWLDVSSLSVSLSPGLYAFYSDPIAGVIKGVLILGLLAASGAAFVRQAWVAKDKAARIKAGILGAGYVITGTATGFSSMVFHSFDSPVLVYEYLFLVGFLIYIIATLPRGKRLTKRA